MKTQIPTPDAHQDMREALRDLCGRFDSAYWQKVDTERGYPEAFVDALTEAGWLAAMIPTEYGGSGLGLTEASVVMHVDRARRYASDRVVFNRPIGQNQYQVAPVSTNLIYFYVAEHLLGLPRSF